MSPAVAATWIPVRPLDGHGEVHHARDPHRPAVTAPAPAFPLAGSTRLIRCTAFVPSGRNTRPPPLTRAPRTLRSRSISP